MEMRIADPTSSHSFRSGYESTSDGDYSPPNRDKRRAASPAKAGDAGLTYRVDINDKDGKGIASIGWPREFNLECALSEARSREGRLPVSKSEFQLVSIVGVDLDKDLFGRRLSRDHDDALSTIVQRSSVTPELLTTKLAIRSAPFVDALKSSLLYDPGQELSPEELVIHEPFALVAHHLDKLKDKKKELDKLNESLLSSVSPLDRDRRAETCEAARALDVVLTFMARTLEDRMAKERELHAREVPICTFHMLWMLFFPGKMVYVRTGARVFASVIGSVTMRGAGCLSGQSHQLGPCKFNLWYLDYDGNSQSVARVTESAAISPFMGEREILSLDVVPCDIWDKMDGGKLRAKLEALGKKWFGLLPGQCGHYEGQLHSGRSVSEFRGKVFVDPVSCFEVRERVERMYVRSRVLGESPDARDRISVFGSSSGSDFVDRWLASAGSSRQKRENTGAQRWHKFRDIPLSETEGMDKSCDQETLKLRYLLVSKRINAFIFKTREWDTIDVEFCEKLKANRTPFDRLVIPEARKDMIRSLVYKYTDRKTSPWSADHIQNKGDGQIFLLHGSPGVGKTFTAECIAELTGQPLLALTCADIGTDEAEMEAKLGKWLKLGHRWGAIMLIDEADVLMEKRQHADLKRNSLVSVFLREIEYYRGILFLTTNRVGQFDDAFISRIHVVIHYDNLNKKERDRIWNQFFDKLEDEKGEEIKILRSARRYVLEDPDITRVPWNGREIRNAFQTAVALAEYRFLTIPAQEKAEGDMAELRAEDLKQVCEMTKAFKKYLAEVHDDYDEFERAALNKLRRGSVGDCQE